MIEPSYPDLVSINCIPYMYHSTITKEFITKKYCYAIRLDTNYYFDVMDLLGEKNEIKEWLDNYMEKK